VAGGQLRQNVNKTLSQVKKGSVGKWRKMDGMNPTKQAKSKGTGGMAQVIQSPVTLKKQKSLYLNLY
jgi:hypothetical protein